MGFLLLQLQVIQLLGLKEKYLFKQLKSSTAQGPRFIFLQHGSPRSMTFLLQE